MANKLAEPTTEQSPSESAGPQRRGRWIVRWVTREMKVRGWHVGLAILVTLVLVGGAMGAGTGSLEEEVEKLEAELSSTRDELDNSVQQSSRLEDQVADANAAADSAYEDAKEEVLSELSDRSSQLDERAEALDSREGDLGKREKAVGIKEKAIDQDSFADGRYKVGSDIKAGTYRTEGDGNCYFAKLRSSDSIDIISNHFGSGPQTVVVDSPWFESQNCGTWVPA